MNNTSMIFRKAQASSFSILTAGQTHGLLARAWIGFETLVLFQALPHYSGTSFTVTDCFNNLNINSSAEKLHFSIYPGSVQLSGIKCFGCQCPTNKGWS